MLSAQMLFCDECGAANSLQETTCFACKQMLAAPIRAVQPVNIQNNASTALSTFTDALAPGFLLAQRYIIVREVGQGGFGIVYEAKDCQRKSRSVAVKQINLCALKPREVIEATDSYNREVTLLSALEHKNVPRIYDHFTDQDHWYLVMDFIKGETLEDYLANASGGRLPLKKVLSIGIELCNVLDYLHKHNQPIIFRDVKPANIMRTSKGRLYLIDFGIARQFTPGQSKDTGPLGSPGYAAPEQYGKAQTTVQTDVYGLGATLQTLLTGVEPLTTPPAHISIPKKMQKLLDQMLEADPMHRPGNMEEVKRRLQRIKDGFQKPALSLLRGLLTGSMPYSLIALLLLSWHLIPLTSTFASFNLVFFVIYYLLMCTWPFVLIAQLIRATKFLFTPQKRLIGLGILLMQGLLILGIINAWLPYQFF